ncbi:hypothetical protein KCP74_05800 [Salmonella enterica subsp. enterica]|nr:hypothetical protein KCP74_05800 [Salmonella enterica subsp. enterica]
MAAALIPARGGRLRDGSHDGATAIVALFHAASIPDVSPGDHCDCHWFPAPLAAIDATIPVLAGQV